MEHKEQEQHFTTPNTTHAFAFSHETVFFWEAAAAAGAMMTMSVIYLEKMEEAGQIH